MTGVRKTRQDAIRSLVRNSPVRTQSTLAAQLKDHGFEVTQATISRDIAEMGLEKDADGIYVLPEDHRFKLAIASSVLETRRAANQVLLLTNPGTASSVAAALDAASIDGVLGSIAGDDTVLVICADEVRGGEFQENVDRIPTKR